MMDELKKKVEQAIKLLQSVKVEGPIEVGSTLLIARSFWRIILR